jgi:hypothetical protein
METPIDFDSAARFLQIARAAHDAGDETKFRAARKLIAVALQIESEAREITKRQ